MRTRLNRIAHLPGISMFCAAALIWVLTGFALADPELSPRATLGGAKALFVVLAVAITMLAVYRSGLLRRRD